MPAYLRPLSGWDMSQVIVVQSASEEVRFQKKIPCFGLIPSQETYSVFHAWRYREWVVVTSMELSHWARVILRTINKSRQWHHWKSLGPVMSLATFIYHSRYRSRAVCEHTTSADNVALYNISEIACKILIQNWQMYFLILPKAVKTSPRTSFNLRGVFDGISGDVIW